MMVYVLTENEPHEGGEVIGAYSSMEKAQDAAAERPPSPDWLFYLIHPVELDALPQSLDRIGPRS